MFHSLITLPIRCTVSQNENQTAVVQELDSYADAAPKCQWCHPVQRKEVRGAGEREGKSMEITFQNPYIFSATSPHLHPHPVQEHTGLSDDPGMLPGRKRWAVKVRFNPSYQRLEAGVNSCLECPPHFKESNCQTKFSSPGMKFSLIHVFGVEEEEAESRAQALKPNVC